MKLIGILYHLNEIITMSYVYRNEVDSMRRNVTKTLDAYKSIAEKTKECFYASDIDSIYKISNGDPFTCINNALNYGFVIGYKAGRKDEIKENIGK